MSARVARIRCRVDVPVSDALPSLHGIIRTAMGWTGSHLYEFEVRGAGQRWRAAG